MDGSIQILDVKERPISSDDVVKPPKPPVAGNGGGFPEHKKRVSAFKRQRQAGGGGASNITTTTAMLSRDIGGQPSSPSSRSRAAAAPRAQADDDTENKDEAAAERRRIDKENRDMLASMSAQEIADMQKELYNGLDPRLIQMLLRRANLDDGGGGGQKKNDDDDPFATTTGRPTEQPVVVVPPEIKITDERDDDKPVVKQGQQQQKPKKKTVSFDPDLAAPATPSQPEDAQQQKDVPSSGDVVHFPTPPRVPDLDPSDPNFLDNLHNKFFPDLPSDPSKLAWMAPIPTPDSIADRDSPYYPGQESLPVSALRFDFRGALIPPRLSRTIPVTKGLHHHGEAPEAAGYTIPELARLARSAVAAQRCIAFQTLGRMLYRLGKGEWGHGKGGRDGEEDDLAFALWRCFREGKVLESLQEAANVPDGQGHLSSKMYATEALWLFEKGGWRERWRGM